jgi:hypothetical protein
MNEAKRPSSVVWAGVLFWLMSLATFLVHIVMSQRGVVDLPSFVFAGLLLLAALLWLLSPRSRLTFYVGAASLVICVIRGVLTARTEYYLRAQFPSIMPQVIGSLVLSLLIAWLAYRFVFGAPSRRYFQLQ